MTRIVEFGPFSILARTHPKTTIRFWTGKNVADSLGETVTHFGARRLFNLNRALINDAIDVIACHVPDRALPLLNVKTLAYEIVIRPRSAPLIGLDFNDDVPLSPMALRVLDRCRIYFKRELPRDRAKLLPNGSAAEQNILDRNLFKIRPISIGLAPSKIEGIPEPLPEKSTDVFYAGAILTDVRRRGAELLAELALQGVRVDFARERLEKADYLRRTAKAYLVWSPEGFGWQCFRHLEAAAAGSVPIMNRADIEVPDPLQPGHHCFQYDPNGSDLIGVIKAALTDKHRLCRMGLAARRYVVTHHMHSAVADQIVRAALA